jgi:hypothetical protein
MFEIFLDSDHLFQIVQASLLFLEIDGVFNRRVFVYSRHSA